MARDSVPPTGQAPAPQDGPPEDVPPAPRPMRGRDWLGLGTLVIAVTALSTWWQDHRAAAEGPALAALARPGDIRMISSVTCVYCTRAREWLTTHRVAHSECFIEREPACLAQYQALGGPGTPTLLVRGQVQRSFSPQAVRERLEEAANPGRGGG